MGERRERRARITQLLLEVVTQGLGENRSKGPPAKKYELELRILHIRFK
jgi:hypothetical protein